MNPGLNEWRREVSEPQFRSGLFEMPDAEYFAAPGMSQSALKHFRRSPAHYKAALENPIKPTAAMRLGTLFDRLVFDHAGFESSVARKPDGFDGRTAVGKDWVKANAGRDHLSVDEWETLCRMKVSLLAHPLARACLAQGKAQQCLFAPFSLGGTTQIKAKVDWAPPYELQTPSGLVKSNCLVDLKTTTDASPGQFTKKILDLDYHVQAAWYLDLWNLVTGEDRECFAFIVIETEPPFAVSVFNLKADAIGIGRKTYIDALAKFIDCERTNTWPAYSNEIVEIGLPAWANKEAA